MQSGITLATWFKRESRRVHGLFTETDEEADQRRLIEWLEARGGAATVRDLTRGPRRFRNKPNEAEAALTALVNAGLGHWESPPSNQKGGVQHVFFALSPSVTVTKTPLKDLKTKVSVTVTVVTPKLHGPRRRKRLLLSPPYVAMMPARLVFPRMEVMMTAIGWRSPYESDRATLSAWRGRGLGGWGTEITHP
ncbi:MAG: hypothetical protein WBH86_02215 [Thermogutta sp.]|nr:hypothetical protein [Thermogutta sp.]HOP78720.1 hypothetical protein [Thermogutta sp.]HPU07635.1 hypothetical protein [Thermogutta sp.]HQF14159.1 hypothetical protein [Thermogutta sp.]